MSTTSKRHPIFARVYERVGRGADQAGGAEHRDELLQGLTGQVLEVGAGNGLNFGRYPGGVTRVLAVEPEPYLRERARQAAAAAHVPIEVVDGTAEALPARDGEFDAAVVSLVLCSVRDQDRALAEIHRTIRPGGELRFYEHVLSERPGPARVQRLLDGTVYPFLAGGCHLSRDTAAAIRRAGFEIERLEPAELKAGPVAPLVPHILGRARRP